MSIIKLVAFPAKRELSCAIAKRCLEAVSPATHERFLFKRQKTVDISRCAFIQAQDKRLLHTTQTNRDLEAALKAIGAGIAATGVIGPGIGLGLIFGNMMGAIARNPSSTKVLFQYGILGAAMCEAVAFFALMISFIALA